MYRNLSSQYDFIIGSRSGDTQYILEKIKKFAPHAKNILEVACGTGAVLEMLLKEYEVEGLDISRDMLERAKKRLPKTIFHHNDMRSFELNKKYDVILCLFDSINHLLEHKDWEQAIQTWIKHLTDEGVIIFDANTKAQLMKLAEESPFFREYSQGYVMMNITDTLQTFKWDILAFEEVSSNCYKLHKEEIHEIALEASQITEIIRKNAMLLDKSIQKYISESNEPARECFVLKKQAL